MKKIIAIILCVLLLAIPVAAANINMWILYTFDEATLDEHMLRYQKDESYVKVANAEYARPGDFNFDGLVNSKDVANYITYLAGYEMPQKVVLATADINFDGKLNNKDVAYLMKYLAGWDTRMEFLD